MVKYGLFRRGKIWVENLFKYVKYKVGWSIFGLYSLSVDWEKRRFLYRSIFLSNVDEIVRGFRGINFVY